MRNYMSALLLCLLAITLTSSTALFASPQCQNPTCANDEQGILGDETLTCDPVDEADFSHYELGVIVDGEARPCGAPYYEPEFFMPGTSCDTQNTGEGYVVRAWDTEGLHSENWSNVVIVLPYACLRNFNCRWEWNEHAGQDIRVCDTCEEPCYDNAPRRLLHLDACANGNTGVGPHYAIDGLLYATLPDVRNVSQAMHTEPTQPRLRTAIP